MVPFSVATQLSPMVRRAGWPLRRKLFPVEGIYRNEDARPLQAYTLASYGQTSYSVTRAVESGVQCWFDRRIKRGLPSRLDAFQFRDAACGHPFGNVDIAVGSEAGVVRMNELAVDPFVWLTSQILNLIQAIHGTT